MADSENERKEDSGSKDRATVALVDAKVDGLRELIRAEFAHVKEDVRALAAVVSDVIRQGVRLDEHERRLDALETDKATDRATDREYRRNHLPSILIAAAATVIAIVTLVATLLH